MSEPHPNVEVFAYGLDAFSRGAFEESIATLHPEIEWHIAFRLPDLPLEADVARGRDEVRVLWAAFTSAWESMAVTVEEILHVDDERVVARVRFRGTGEASGVVVDRPLVYSARIEDGQLAYIRGFADEASARRDAGLDVE